MNELGKKISLGVAPTDVTFTLEEQVIPKEQMKQFNEGLKEDASCGHSFGLLGVLINVEPENWMEIVSQTYDPPQPSFVLADTETCLVRAEKEGDLLPAIIFVDLVEYRSEKKSTTIVVGKECERMAPGKLKSILCGK